MQKGRWSKAGTEPTLWEALADPIVQSLMKADRVVRKDVLAAIAGDEARLEARAQALPLSA